MRRLVFTLLILCAVAPALAQTTLPVDIPTAEAVVTSADQCNRLRVALRIHTDDWTNPICATLMTRAGVRAQLVGDLDAQTQTFVNSARSTADASRQSQLDTFDFTDWPLPVEPVACGDGRVDTEFGEECDDSGESVDCNVDCTLSVCGDGVLNVTDGEQCDDANTDPGDGCDATCQTE